MGTVDVSIRILRAEGDIAKDKDDAVAFLFQSAPSVRRATSQNN